MDSMLFHNSVTINCHDIQELLQLILLPIPRFVPRSKNELRDPFYRGKIPAVSIPDWGCWFGISL
jgi:hypothetical protein